MSLATDGPFNSSGRSSGIPGRPPDPDGSYKVTPATWAAEHIYDKMANRVDTINAGVRTVKPDGKEKYVGPDTAPSVDDLKNIKLFNFEIKGDWPELNREI